MFKLRVQVFLAFVGFALLLTMGLFFYSRLSFEHSFTRYLEGRENERNAVLLEALSSHYQRTGSWDAFQQPGRWEWFVNQYRRMGQAMPEPERERDREPPQEPPRWSPPAQPRIQPLPDWINNERWILRLRALRTRFILQDADKRQVAGEEANHEHYIYSRIQSPDNKTLGYLGTPINPALRDLLDTQFAERQQTHFLVMTLIALGIALLCAIPLSYLLTQRVQRLARHVQSLSAGRYQERLSVSGSDELSTLAQHLNHLGQSLEQSEQTRKRWVADISHELRTPLAVLQADLEALEDGVRHFDAKALARLQKHAARLTHLVNDLYELSLTDIGALSYRKQPCELYELVSELCHSLDAKFVQAGLDFSTDLGSDKIPVFADPQRLQQLLLNVLHNSINYTNSPGQVRLCLQRDDKSALIRIDDTEPGVDPELHEKLFERLYRAESSRSRDTGGAGLGLSICRNIVEAHSGSIAISNSDLGGLAVSIRLPLLQE
ncbi:ATP-binding protein [Cellvibrio japonicus]|nr:ATP-binding protein [Cellvibrio japonicus]